MVQSQIFDGSERKLTGKGNEREKDLLNQVDLTVAQQASMEEQITEVDQDLDILEAEIDAKNVDALARKIKIHEELDHEKLRIKTKYLKQYALQESDPFKLWS